MTQQQTPTKPKLLSSPMPGGLKLVEPELPLKFNRGRNVLKHYELQNPELTKTQKSILERNLLINEYVTNNTEDDSHVSLTSQEEHTAIERMLFRYFMIKLLMTGRNNTPNTYLLTLSFKIGTPDTSCDWLLREYINRLNQRCYRYKYTRRHLNRRAIEGVVVREYHKNGTPHYHILIQDPEGDLEDFIPFRKAMLLVNESFARSKPLHKELPTYISHLASYSLQAAHQSTNKNVGRLEKYLTKVFEKPQEDFKAIVDEFAFIHNGTVTLFRSDQGIKFRLSGIRQNNYGGFYQKKNDMACFH